jgi:hypothetical protein|tara:strand:- start:85 stop:348 length:264 start_codon:yes stop_codon:yes gene_type:complete
MFSTDSLGFLGLLIIIAVIVFIIWLLPKAFKGWKVSWVGLIVTGFLAFLTAGGTPLKLIAAWIIYYLIAVVIIKAIKEVRDFFRKKK